jgi:glutamate/tyrosine decarboxylase-like PLP-dependent enzyme
VIGGAHPAGVAADWLVSAWDQNAGLAGPTPAVTAVEAVAGAWLLELLGLPADASFAFVTGCQMAHVTALAAARHHVLATTGHDVEREGLAGAPAIRVLTGEERHVTIDRALRFLGIGAAAVQPVAVDERGAMRADALRRALAAGAGRPTIVAAQIGNVNTGAVDPMPDVCAAAHEAGAWVHVDGAFGLWAAASPSRRELVRGVEHADSWATDAHKWLNVPYDCGLAVVRETDAHRAAMAVTAAYLVQDPDGPREPMDWTPEFSRRARGVAVYATLRALGRSGVAELVDRLCDCAERFAARLAASDGFDVIAQGLNQVLVRVGDDDDHTLATLAAVQADGTCWPSATTWRGRRCIRLSVSSWQTTAEDVDRSVEALVRAAAATGERGRRRSTLAP